jgi:hypothetical protein
MKEYGLTRKPKLTEDPAREVATSLKAGQLAD